MNFLISLPSIFNRMIGLNILGESYKALLGLGMMMELHKQLLTMRYLHDNLSGSGVNELLHLKIILINSFSENNIHIVSTLFGISSNNSKLI